MWHLIVLLTVFAGLWAAVQRTRLWLNARHYARVYGTELPVRLQDVAPLPKGETVASQTMQAFKEYRYLDLVKARHDAAGYTYRTVALGKSVYHTSEPENIKAILATHFEDYALGFRMAVLGPVIGKGAFTADGKDWEMSRALIRPNFVRAQIVDLSLIDKHCEQLLSSLPYDGSTVDLQELFLKMTFDTSTEFVFGESVHAATAPDDSVQSRFVKAFDYAAGQLLPRLAYGPFLFLYRNKKFDESCELIRTYADDIIARAMERKLKLKTSLNGDTQTTDNKTSYIFLYNLLDTVSDPARLRSECLNVLQAGRDTTASLLSHSFYNLARRPDLLAKLISEVDTLNGAKPTYDNLKSMTYLRYFLNESLRVWPVAPINSKIATKDTILPTGGGLDHKSPVFVPKGTKISFPIFPMHRNKAIYGPDADEYRPERWADPSFRPGWAYLPFNGGPRKCLGQNFALTEASYTMVRILQHFKGVEVRDHGPYQEAVRISLAIHNGVKVAMIPR